MSARDIPVSRLNLEQLRKRAKDLRKAHGAADPAAADRIRAQLPRAAAQRPAQILAAPLRWSEALHVIAREAGFASWTEALRHIELVSASGEAAESALVRAAVAGDAAAVTAALAQAPELRERSFFAALTLADASAVDAWLKRDPELATRPGGPHGWSPLLYLCRSRHQGGARENAAARVAIARRLLELGADPSDGSDDAQTMRGYRSALSGAVGCARTVELARVLLDAGADVKDGPSIYEGCALWEAVRQRDLASLRLLLERGSVFWQVHHALHQCLAAHSPEMVRLLLAHGANPDWTKGSLSCGGTTLHEAIALGCPDEILELLLDARAARDFLDRDGRTPLAFAVRLGAVSAERILRGRGADDAQVAPVDRWVGACFQEDEHAAATLLRERFELTRAEHQLVPRAIRSGKPLAVRLLLAGGARPDVPDDDGQSALHLAAARADTALCALLLDQGAPLEARNFDEKTPLECAQTHAATRAFLLARGAREAASEADAGERAERFERAADCVVSGDLEELRTLLARDPDLVRARSPRPHRATLLHYAAANGVEAARQRTPPNAVEVVQLLLDAGSDPDALCFTFRGGPEQTMLGLLTTSGHPVKAGLLLPLVATMLRAGAHASPRYELLVDLREACAAGRSHSIALDPASERAELALTDAARLGELELVRDLLDRGVHVDAAPENRITALHQAAFSGNAKLCEHLLELGADLGARDALYNGVPAGWAEAGGHPELARSLADRARATHKEESR